MRKTFLKKALREVRAHWLQYLLLVLVLAFGIAGYSAFNNLAASRWATFDAIYEESHFMDLQINYQYGVTTNLSHTQDILAQPGLAERILPSSYV